MKKNTLTYLKQFFKDIIPVVFGILIALLINNWNESRKDEIYIDKFYSSLKKELAETNEDIIYKMPLQQSLIDTLDFYATNNKVSIVDIMQKNNGIHAPTIRINYWKAISNSKIELLEYEKLSVLATIEEEKEDLNLKIDKLSNLLYSKNIFDTEKETKEIIKFMMYDIMNSEEYIQGRIEYILND